MQQASNNGLVNRLSLTVSNSSTEVGLASETRSTSVAWKLTCKLYVNTSFKSYRSDGSFVARVFMLLGSTLQSDAGWGLGTSG